MKTIKGLTEGSVIRVAGLSNINKVTICTLAAFAAKGGESVADCEARDVKFKRATQYAWTYQEAGCISADYKGKAEALAAERAAITAAPVVETGDVLVVDGVGYTAKVLGDYSDPVKLVRIEKQPERTQATASNIRIKVVKPNGFEIVSDANRFARVVAGEYSTKAQRRALEQLYPRFLSIACKPIVWGQPDPSEAEHAALVAVAEAAKRRHFSTDSREHHELEIAVGNALAALELVRKEGAK